jgi:methionine-gamma-lyase
LPGHPQHELMKSIMNEGYGFGGMITLDLMKATTSNEFMRLMQMEGVGYLAVSLGYFKTLFSNPGKSTSSEVPEDVQRRIGLSEGLVRFSIGLDNDISRSFMKMKECLTRLSLI